MGSGGVEERLKELEEELKALKELLKELVRAQLAGLGERETTNGERRVFGERRVREEFVEWEKVRDEV